MNVHYVNEGKNMGFIGKAKALFLTMTDSELDTELAQLTGQIAVGKTNTKYKMRDQLYMSTIDNREIRLELGLQEKERRKNMSILKDNVREYKKDLPFLSDDKLKEEYNRINSQYLAAVEFSNTRPQLDVRSLLALDKAKVEAVKEEIKRREDKEKEAANREYYEKEKALASAKTIKIFNLKDPYCVSYVSENYPKDREISLKKMAAHLTELGYVTEKSGAQIHISQVSFFARMPHPVGLGLSARRPDAVGKSRNTGPRVIKMNRPPAQKEISAYDYILTSGKFSPTEQITELKKLRGLK